MRNAAVCVALAFLTAFTVLNCGGGSSSSDKAGSLTVIGAASSDAAAPLMLLASAPRAVPTASPPPVGGCEGCDPSSVRIYVEQLWLGQSADCTDLEQAVDKGGDADYQEMTASPTLIDGSVPAGTYECMALKMRDVIYFTPNAAAFGTISACEDQEYGHDIFKDVFDNPESWYDPELGDVTVAAGDFASAVAGSVVQDVFVYFSTSHSQVGDTVTSTALLANPDLHKHQLLKLSESIVIEADEQTQKLLYFDFRNQVVQDNGYCTLDAPDAGFK